MLRGRYGIRWMIAAWAILAAIIVLASALVLNCRYTDQSAFRN
jgi:hypothetical protein